MYTYLHRYILVRTANIQIFSSSLHLLNKKKP
jgi:hypothetical protein